MMRKIRLKKRKGDAALFAIIALAVSGVIALGLAKVQHYGFHTLDTSEEFLKAEQFALETSEEIRNTSFAAVTAVPKTQISSGGQDNSGKVTPSGYYKEVQINRDGIFKDCKVNIYKGSDSKPVLSVNVAKVNPRALVWGGFTDKTEDSEDETTTVANNTWSAMTTQNFVNGKLINDYRMTDAKGSFSAKASIDYINDKLKNYIEDYKCLKRPAGDGVGTTRQPIYVNSNKVATVCAINYTLNEEREPSYIGILRKDSSGNIVLDRWAYDDFKNKQETTGSGGDGGDSGGGNAGTGIIGTDADLPTATTWLIDKTAPLDINGTENITITIPKGVKILYLKGRTSTDVAGIGDATAIIIVKNNDNAKEWTNLTTYTERTDQHYNDIDNPSDDTDLYIGVTPGKTYTLSINVSAEWGLFSGDGAAAESHLQIGYSKSINSHTPDITDY